MKGLGLSLVLHGALFAAGAWLWVQPVQYGVALGQSAVEIELVAAPAAPPSAPVSTPPAAVEAEPEAVVLPEPAQPEAVLPSPDRVEAKKAEPVHAPVSRPEDLVGDGSSPIPGIHAVTQRAAAGAQIAARPNYLKNPAPRYPEDSRLKGQEGVVLIEAHIDRSGRPTQIELFRSSGYRSLDRSALNSVKRWVFEPARVGPLTVESVVQIPVRFRLSDR